MRFLIVFSAFIAATVSFAADQGGGISEKALNCANMPAGTPSEYSITFDITFADKGAIKDIKVQDYHPHDLLGKVVVLALSRAVQRCAPYEDIKAGVISVKFSSDTSSEYINPFK